MRKTGMATNVLASLSFVALASCGGSASEGDIQGTVSGLGTGLSVTLQDNGADNLTLTTNGAFGFDTGLPAGGAFRRSNRLVLIFVYHSGGRGPRPPE